MKKFCRVFLKGSPVTWIDFPMPDDATGLQNFVSQMRFEGFACNAMVYVPFDEVRCALFVQMEGDTVFDFSKARSVN